jgi:hypothetical protein
MFDQVFEGGLLRENEFDPVQSRIALSFCLNRVRHSWDSFLSRNFDKSHGIERLVDLSLGKRFGSNRRCDLEFLRKRQASARYEKWGEREFNSSPDPKCG